MKRAEDFRKRVSRLRDAPPERTVETMSDLSVFVMRLSKAGGRYNEKHK